MRTRDLMIVGLAAAGGLAASQGLGAASPPAPSPVQAAAPAPAPATPPQVVVVSAGAPGADAAAGQHQEVLARLDLLAAEVARLSSELAAEPAAAPAPAPAPAAAPDAVTEVHHWAAPVTVVESDSYSWHCADAECTYLTTVYSTQGNEAGQDAGDIDAVTYVCLPSRNRAEGGSPAVPEGEAQPAPVQSVALADASGEPSRGPDPDAGAGAGGQASPTPSPSPTASPTATPVSTTTQGGTGNVNAPVTDCGTVSN